MKIITAFLLFGVALFAGPSSSGAISGGSGGSASPGGGGFIWGVGVGGNCRNVVDKMRRNWMDVRPIVAPKSKSMRPRSRDFYCVSPYYTQQARPKLATTLTGLKCFDLQGKGFCCDAQLSQCATL